MIAIEHRDALVTLTVLGEFTLADFKEFEALVLDKIKFSGPVRLLVDLREMASFTLDMAWEEVKFSRAHPDDFERIAIVTDSEWITWSAWLQRLFVRAEISTEHDIEDARAWLAQ
jgi:hypothetical protein